MNRILIMAVGLTAAPATALAAAPAVPGPGDVLSLGSGLLLVIGAILVTGWLYTRTQRLRGATGDVIRVVASRALGTRERVVLLEVGGKQLLVGMTSQQVQTLHVFDEPVAAIPDSGPGFAERLRDAVRGRAQ